MALVPFSERRRITCPCCLQLFPFIVGAKVPAPACCPCREKMASRSPVKNDESSGERSGEKLKVAHELAVSERQAVGGNLAASLREILTYLGEMEDCTHHERQALRTLKGLVERAEAFPLLKAMVAELTASLEVEKSKTALLRESLASERKEWEKRKGDLARKLRAAEEDRLTMCERLAAVAGELSALKADWGLAAGVWWPEAVVVEAASVLMAQAAEVRGVLRRLGVTGPSQS